MQRIVRQNLDTITTYLGLGDSRSAKILFIGVEQGGTGVNLQSQIDQSSELVTWKPNEKMGKPWSPVWTKIARVSSTVTGFSDHRKYRENRLFQNGSFEVLIDLFPLSKPSKKKWDSYQDYLSKQEYQNWLLENIEKRYRRIRSVQASMANRIATVCFGKENWRDHIKCLGLEDAPKAYMGNGRDMICLYSKTRTILAPFFGNGAISNAVLDKIVLEIKILQQHLRV